MPGKSTLGVRFPVKLNMQTILRSNLDIGALQDKVHCRFATRATITVCVHANACQ